MAKTQVNVLMIGRSGAGKSSLLNYIYGANVEKTGTGEPCTKKGIFSHIVNLNSNCVLNVHDTWGLEPNKAEEWLGLIHDEICRHNVEMVKDWFHFIIYCISAKSDRIEDFERDFIKRLLSEGNNVIIVFTQCDCTSEENLLTRVNYLKGIGVDSKDIIRTCSVEKKLIGGKRTSEYGKEELLDRIQRNFWKSICEKIPQIINDYAVSKIDDTTKGLKNYVEDNINFFNMHSGRKHLKMSDYCNRKYSECTKNIDKYAEDKLKEAVNYYVAVCGTFYPLVGNKNVDYRMQKVRKINFSMDFSDKLAEILATIVMGLIPLVNLVVPWAAAELKQDEFKSSLDSVSEELINSVNEICKEMYNYLCKLDV